MKKKRLHRLLQGYAIEVPSGDVEKYELHSILHNLGYTWASGTSLLQLFYKQHTYLDEVYVLGWGENGENLVSRSYSSNKENLTSEEFYKLVYGICRK